ncbi:MAG TPA: class I SAM-dependent methyltransferase [Blastocatellia bacterium]|nr:class I SAM-dependent methyltransferase [Blastocatellia bacterium]
MGLYSDHIFPRILEWGLGNRMIDRQRLDALREARGDVLEVGFGTGLNLPHYPETVTRLVALDSHRMLEKRVEARIARARMPVERVQLDASGRLPFDDDRFDTVVTTFTLCSIADLGAALSEMRRVMKPEGRFIFLEHGRSENPRTASLQDLFNPLQKIVGCGCNMNRRIDRLIEQSGFRIERLDRFILPDTPGLFGSMYRGAASKE